MKPEDADYKNQFTLETDVNINNLFSFLKLRNTEQNERIKVGLLQEMIGNYDKVNPYDSIDFV